MAITVKIFFDAEDPLQQSTFAVKTKCMPFYLSKSIRMLLGNLVGSFYFLVNPVQSYHQFISFLHIILKELFEKDKFLCERHIGTFRSLSLVLLQELPLSAHKSVFRVYGGKLIIHQIHRQCVGHLTSPGYEIVPGKLVLHSDGQDNDDCMWIRGIQVHHECHNVLLAVFILHKPIVVNRPCLDLPGAYNVGIVSIRLVVHLLVTKGNLAYSSGSAGQIEVRDDVPSFLLQFLL